MNSVLSIGEQKINFSVDISELQNKMDELIVFGRLMGYKYRCWIARDPSGNPKSCYCDFENEDLDKYFYINFVYRGADTVQEVTIFYDDGAHNYGVSKVKIMLYRIDLVMHTYM